MKELIWGKSTIRLHGSSAERLHYGPLFRQSESKRH